MVVFVGLWVVTRRSCAGFCVDIGRGWAGVYVVCGMRDCVCVYLWYPCTDHDLFVSRVCCVDGTVFGVRSISVRVPYACMYASSLPGLVACVGFGSPCDTYMCLTVSVRCMGIASRVGVVFCTRGYHGLGPVVGVWAVVRHTGMFSMW